MSLTLKVVVLDRHHSPSSGLGTVQHQLLVNGLSGREREREGGGRGETLVTQAVLVSVCVCAHLEAEGVHHSDVDALCLQSVVGSDRLVQSHSSTHHRHLVTV